jgi:DNA polymerase III subunit epsilon
MSRTRKPNIKLRQKIGHIIDPLPDSPGVYLFFGASGELLYVGKSKTIRSRVRAHFASPDERRMCALVRAIDIRRTAGELGALLLESQLIKELKPLWNIRQRQRRRIILGRRLLTPSGYETISLAAVEHIDPGDSEPILAIFRTRTQAAAILADLAKAHRLCPRLLGLERTDRYCFSYHLHQCDGACGGEEPPASYNERFRRAFEERRIKAWPFTGAVLIEEHSPEQREREVFVVDRWCLLYSFAYAEDRYKLGVQGLHRFDYDSYRILAGYIFDRSRASTIRPATRAEIETLLENARAA